MSALCCACLLPKYMYRPKVVKPAGPYTYAQMKQDLHTLHHRYQSRMQLCIYGYSREGRPLYAAVVGDTRAKNALLLQGGIHAREHMTSLLLMSQLEYLLRRGVPKGACIHILPMTNPDGVTLSQTGLYNEAQRLMYDADRRNGYTQKTIEAYMRKFKANAVDVDLNRNFDAMFERVNTHPYPAAQGYRGPYAGSEPETCAIVKYTQHRRFETTLSYHATGSEIYYAFQDHAKTNEAGRKLAQAVNKKLRYALRGDSGTSFGGYKDWAISKAHIPSLTIEIGKGSAPLAPEEFQAIWRAHYDLPLVLLRAIKKVASPLF